MPTIRATSPTEKPAAAEVLNPLSHTAVEPT
jgi:hypothetical protein